MNELVFGDLCMSLCDANRTWLALDFANVAVYLVED
jgi:hypothetical protein